MVLWIVFAVMTAAALAAVVVPFARKQDQIEAGGTDLAVYRDQLAEIDRDKARGVIDKREAEAARVEVSRRLLGATDHETDPSTSAAPLRPVLAAIVLIVPAVALAGYLAFGSPTLSGQPLAARQQENPADPRMAELVTRVEAHLRANPDDGRGWDVIAPVYMSIGRYDESVLAYRAAIRLQGSTSSRQADLGEALVHQAGGVITADAAAAFQAALLGGGDSPKARFYLAQAAEQDGRLTKARELWAELLEISPANAPWVPEVRARLNRVETELGVAPSAPGPTTEQVEAAQDMSAEDRMAMIEGMIAQLDQRLTDEGGTAEEWVRLIRSLMVLDKADDARNALDRARTDLADNPDALAQVNAAAGSFGLGG